MQIKKPPQIDVEGISLRNLRISDVEAWYDYLRRPEVVEHTSWNLQCQDDLLPQFSGFASDSLGSPIRLAIVNSADDHMIGTVGFHTLSDVNLTAELAYDLAPEYWGRRIVQAAAEALCVWGFTELNLNRIQASVLETNHASCKVLERLGFEREGYLRAFRVVRGLPGNFWMYSRINPTLSNTVSNGP